MKRGLVLIICLCCCAGILSAQSADRLDKLLASTEITYAEAAAFVLPAAERIQENSSGDAAFSAAASMGLVPEKAQAGDAITLGQLSLLIMKSFEIKGGLMYRMLPVPRYAYREMVYKQIIQGKSDPGMAVSGERLLMVLGRALSYTEESL